MPIGRTVLALAAGDRWLLAFSLATLAVLGAGVLTRRAARVHRARSRVEGSSGPRLRRRRAGVIIALGPIIGFATAPTLGEHALLIAGGAVALAVATTALERRPDPGRQVAMAVLAASALAVVVGVRLGPTGVGLFDVVGGFAVVALVTAAVDGLGDADGLVPGLGGAVALGVFALAGFAGQDSLAAVAAGLGGACLAFLAFNLRPASLFVGRAGRLAIGYSLAVGVLSVDLPIEPGGRLVTPLILLGLLLLDALVVVADRLRRRRPLFEPRNDHLVHRLLALRWPAGTVVVVLVGAQLALVIVAVFTGRGVMAPWLGIALLVLVLVIVGREAARGRIDREPPRGLSRRARVVTGVVAGLLLLAVIPTVLVVADVRDAMERGREAATGALAAAREGDDARADLGFRQAAAAFDEAYDTLHGLALDGGLIVPGIAPNLRAARTLSEIGRDLAHAGERVTQAVDPTSLEVVEGRLPLEEVRRVTPALEDGARILERAVTTMRGLDDPYLLPVVTDTLDKVDRQLAQSAAEARRAAAAARLAPAIFGGDGPRTYLLLVQNNAELRATGGLIGNWGLMTAVDGKVSVGRLLRTGQWNEALAAVSNPTIDAPRDYHERYDEQEPERGLQSVNLSPDFPTVARVASSLAPQIGLPPVDGVLAVDPVGLAALLELTGPVNVLDWPEQITGTNVVNITLRDAYDMFEATPERAEFLGDVAQVVVDEATEGALGAPATIARVLGKAAHEGHVQLSFTRPEEQRLAELLDISGSVPSVRSDALLVNTQNAGANKIDYYLERRLDYRVSLDPDPDERTALVHARVELELHNTAPDSGLPQIVIGPFRPGFVAGVNSAYVSVYTPFHVRAATVEGTAVPVFVGREAGREVISALVDIPAESTRTLALTLEGRVRLRPGGWYDLELGHQPTLVPDQARVSVEVPEGWEIAEAPRLVQPFDRRASGVVILERPRQVRVRVEPKPAALDLWERLETGT